MKVVALLSKKVPLTAVLSVLLAVVSAAVIFGVQFFRLTEQNRALNDGLSSAEKINREMSDSNISKDGELSSYGKRVAELESAVGSLTKTVSDLNKTLSSQKSVNAALQAAVKADDGVENLSSDDILKSISVANLATENIGSRVCYLTFDDGPSDNTLKILDILKTANAKATFFVLGTSKTEYISQIDAAGHTVALHTNTHQWPIYSSEETYYSDLNAVRDKVKKLIGKEVNLIRFPGGSSNQISKKYNAGIMTRLTADVSAKGFKYFDWNVDSGDASALNVPADKIVANVVGASKGKAEICVLMHDTSAKSTTVEALPYIICYLRSCGFRFEAITESSDGFHHQRLNN